MSDCTLCPGNDNTGHEASCQATWKNPKWLNREMIWSHRGDCWIWRELKAVTPAKESKALTATEGTLSIADLKEEVAFAKGMQNWTDEEVEELLGR